MKKDCPILLGFDLEKTKGLSVHLFPMASVSLGSPAPQKDFGGPISFMKGRLVLEENLLGSLPNLWSRCCQGVVCFLFSLFFFQFSALWWKMQDIRIFFSCLLAGSRPQLALGHKETLTPTKDFYRVAFYSCNTRGSFSNLAPWLYTKITYIHFYIMDIFTLKQNTIFVQ